MKKQNLNFVLAYFAFSAISAGAAAVITYLAVV